MSEGLVAKIGTIVKKAPELRFSPKGVAVTKFSLAVKPYVPKGEPQPETTFYEVTAFGSLAEHVAETLDKGHRALVIGTGKLETWTGKDGKERTTKTIIADGVGPDLRFVSAKLGANERAASEPQQFTEYDPSPF